MNRKALAPASPARDSWPANSTYRVQRGALRLRTVTATQRPPTLRPLVARSTRMNTVPRSDSENDTRVPVAMADLTAGPERAAWNVVGETLSDRKEGRTVSIVLTGSGEVVIVVMGLV